VEEILHIWRCISLLNRDFRIKTHCSRHISPFGSLRVDDILFDALLDTCKCVSPLRRALGQEYVV
jgi:hypothetical protein